MVCHFPVPLLNSFTQLKTDAAVFPRQARLHFGFFTQVFKILWKTMFIKYYRCICLNIKSIHLYNFINFVDLCQLIRYTCRAIY